MRRRRKWKRGRKRRKEVEGRRNEEKREKDGMS
jgi:hypothetical protein